MPPSSAHSSTDKRRLSFVAAHRRRGVGGRRPTGRRSSDRQV